MGWRVVWLCGHFVERRLVNMSVCLFVICSKFRFIKIAFCWQVLCWTCRYVSKLFSWQDTLSIYQSFAEPFVCSKRHFVEEHCIVFTRNVLVRHFSNASFAHVCILFPCHILYVSNGQHVNMSLVNLSFCQCAILSACHFVNMPFCQNAILSPYHYVNMPFGSKVILPTCHFVIMPFYITCAWLTSHLFNISIHEQIIKQT